MRSCAQSASQGDNTTEAGILSRNYPDSGHNPDALVPDKAPPRACEALEPPHWCRRAAPVSKDAPALSLPHSSLSLSHGVDGSLLPADRWGTGNLTSRFINTSDRSRESGNGTSVQRENRGIGSGGPDTR
jgi:hypothetical protein